MELQELTNAVSSRQLEAGDIIAMTVGAAVTIVTAVHAIIRKRKRLVQNLAESIEEEQEALLVVAAAPRQRKRRAKNMIRKAYPFGDWTNPHNNSTIGLEETMRQTDMFVKAMRMTKGSFDTIVRDVTAVVHPSPREAAWKLIERRIAIVIRYVENDGIAACYNIKTGI